jgi:hypothetical protein
MFIILLFIIAISFLIIPKYKENWSNTYSGWPGPLENGSGLYNIPALYPNPKYSAKCSYKHSRDRNLTHIQMKDYPNCGGDDLYLSF